MTVDDTTQRPTGLSYKFERLREKLRKAISSGEISGKLPGERVLANRYHVNAKTLSKALTDLAAEGLLDRSIGRGTFVKGHEPQRVDRRWLLLCDEDQSDGELVSLLKEAKPDLEVLTDMDGVRPSFLGHFNAAIDMSRHTPPEFLRQLVVRNFPVVSIGKLPKTFSTHAVIFDDQLAASQAARDLILSGHCAIGVIEPADRDEVSTTLKRVRDRYDPNVTVVSGTASDVPAFIEQGVTAFMCRGCSSAQEVHAGLKKLQISVPRDVSLMAIGTSSELHPCSGYFADFREKVESVMSLLADAQSRPTTVWLASRFVDRGTTGCAPAARDGAGFVPCSAQKSA